MIITIQKIAIFSLKDFCFLIINLVFDEENDLKRNEIKKFSIFLRK
jgi:hypothetical protein